MKEGQPRHGVGVGGGKAVRKQSGAEDHPEIAQPLAKKSKVSTISGAAFSQEQRGRIMKEVLEDHISPGDLSKKYNISAHCIRDWIKKAGHQLPKSYKRFPIATNFVVWPLCSASALVITKS